jgi:hypothetical protein
MMQLFQNANGYKSGIGKITAADNIIQAIQKLDGNQFANQTVSITKDYNILPTDCTIICDARPLTINLPEVNSSPGKIYIIKNR